MSEKQSVRINKYLSEAGFCSRREADKLIDAGAVKINGKIPEMGTKVFTEDVVTVNGKEIKRKESEHIYIAFNKLKLVLDKVNDADFGLCMRCGNPIPIGRILLMPQSRNCVRCAQ